MIRVILIVLSFCAVIFIPLHIHFKEIDKLHNEVETNKEIIASLEKSIEIVRKDLDDAYITQRIVLFGESWTCYKSMQMEEKV